MNRPHGFRAAIAVLVPLLCLALGQDAWAAGGKHKKRKHVPPTQERSLVVDATAYNAALSQTDGDPILGAWGDHLDEIPAGFRAIAVSPDLVGKGLTRNKRVRIEGFKGEFLVLDRTPNQWQNTIDIFMGTDVAAARQFGRKKLKISWTVPRVAKKKSPPRNAGKTTAD